MATAYSSGSDNYMEFNQTPETKATKQIQETKATKQTENKKPEVQKIPAEIVQLKNVYEKIVETPDDIDILWQFVRMYLTYLEKRHDMIVPFFGETGDLMGSLHAISTKTNDIPWGIYKCFKLISDKGSSIAKELNESDEENAKDLYYIMYVMLSFDSNSPVYQFTDLLHALMQEKPEIYETLNNMFLEAFERSVKPRETVKPAQDLTKISILSRTCIIPVIDKEITYKAILIFLVLVLLIAGVGVSGYMYYGKTKLVISDTASDASSVYST